MRWVDWMYLMKSVAPSCRNTVADKIYARWSAFTGWKPLATKWMHYAEAEQFNVFHISLLSLSPRWTMSPPPPGSCAGHCVHQRVLLTQPQASGGGGVLLTGTSQVKKSSLSVMDTQHHIHSYHWQRKHSPTNTNNILLIILLQCLLLLTLFYP